MANLRANRITSTEVFETTGSVQFDGTDDYLSVANSILAFGTDDFTIEFWVYRKKSNYNGYWEQNTVLTTGHLSIYDNADGKITVRIGSSIAIQEDNPQPLNTWGHYAITRKSGIAYFYYNGILNFSGSATGEITPTSARIGALNYNSPAHDFNGHISNFRILKGTALYTTNFTPPTRELEVIPNTVLLACQSTTKADEEKTGKTITVNGNAVANELTPGLLTNVVKSGGSSAITGSVEFDGTGDYLQVPSSDDLELGSSDYTIEFWCYPSRSFDTEEILSKGRPWQILRNSSGQFRFATDSDGAVPYDINTSFGTGAINQWHHISITRKGNNTYGFVNGILGLTVTTLYNIVSSSSALTIGNFTDNLIYPFQGFISNLRIIKGTALYTSNFIPPTRKLTKLPGTVLLCCQDSNDPTTEATGKTITGYGDLQKADGVELVTNGTFDTDTTGWTDIGTDWSVSGGQVSTSGEDVYLDQQLTTVIGKVYKVTFDITTNYSNAQNGIYIRYGNGSGYTDERIDNKTGTFTHIFTAVQTNHIIRLYNGGTSTITFDNVSVTLYDPPNRASDFTPSVGSDGSVEFAGPITINTENYFYLPTGNTESRTLNVATQASSSARGLFGGAYNYGVPSASRDTSDVIDYVTIPSTGNAIDFGDLTESRGPGGACASPTRGVWMGGDKTASPYRSNTIDYVTISSKGNAQDFGDTILPHGHNGGVLSDSTRGISGGGNDPAVSPAVVNSIEYITIASTGNGRDFGDLTIAKYGLGGVASPSRGVFSSGDAGPAFTNTMDYITIQSMGNAIDFGDGITNTSGVGAASNSIRGLFAQGLQSPYQRIDYITIASTGNALEFGNLTTSHYARFKAGAASPTRIVFAGGYANPDGPGRTDMDYVTIMTTGNATDFGDLTTGRGMAGGCSNGHGGLG